MLHLHLNRLQTLGCGFEHSIAHGFYVSADDRQGVAQIVSNIGGHLPPGLKQSIEIRTHLIECRCKFPQFIFGGYDHILFYITPGDGTNSCG